jgi:protein arginine N-methyltransferase 1
MRIEYHRTLLADRVRNAAFHGALSRVIVPGRTVVADIGAGTGFLGFLAAKLGARRVDLYERAEIGAVAEKLIRLNKLRNVKIWAGHSTDTMPEAEADVVVSETLGNYAFEENIIETLNDARQRFLKPGGIVIPGRVTQFVCPVVGERLYRELAVWDEVGYDLDLTPAKTMGLNNIYVRWFEAKDLLDGGRAVKAWDHVDFGKAAKTTRNGEVSWRIDKAQRVYGLGLWWETELVAGVSLSTSPLSPKTHWEQLYLPALEPIAAEAGDTLAVRLRSTTSYEDGTNVAWTLRLLDGKGREKSKQALDLNKGFIP